MNDVIKLLIILLLTPIGGSIIQITLSLICYIIIIITSLFNSTIRSDLQIINYNLFIRNPDKVLATNNIAFYKGVPIFKSNKKGRSGSFGIIFLKKNVNIDTLNHERGHNWQLMLMGVFTYAFTVGIPSPLKLGKWSKDNNYYGAPWETIADILGMAKGRRHDKKEIINAWVYYLISLLAFPFTFVYWCF